MDACPAADALVDLASGDLGVEASAELHHHIRDCAGCQLALAGLGDATEIGEADDVDDVDDPDWLAEPQLQPGERLGRFRLEKLIGAGGMGVVYSAFDPELGRQVALKLLRPEKDELGEGRSRLLREAQAMARLSHPNVVAIYDTGTYRSQVFIAMELIEGGTLSEWRTSKQRSWREIVSVFQRAGQGLAAAHAAGLVHRDFKPDNVLIGKDGRVRVTDFGLARVAEGAIADRLPTPLEQRKLPLSALHSPLTRTGTLLGSPAYMAPEQMEGNAADARSDLFSFSVTLYETLCGERPFAGSTLTELRSEIHGGRLRDPPRGIRFPAFLHRVLWRGMRARPRDRYQTMEALLADLERGPVVRARRNWAAAALVALLAASGLGLRIRQQSRSQLCTGAAAQLAGVWNAPRREQLQRSVAGGAPTSLEAIASFSSSVDAFAADWARMRTQACEATRLRGEQSEALLDLRMSCLDKNLLDLGALVGAVEQRGAAALGAAAQAVAQLPPLSLCANVQALQAVGPLPADAAVRAQVAALQKRDSALRARRIVGDNTGVPEAREVVAAARQLGYRPLLADVLLTLGMLEEVAVDHPRARRTLAEAAATALSTHDDPVAASAFTRLLRLERYAGRLDDARLWSDFAAASIERLGGDDSLETTRLLELGVLFDDEGKYEEAIALYRRALEGGRRLDGGSEGQRSAAARYQLSQSLWGLGRLDEAADEARRSLEIAQRLLGVRNVRTILGHGGLGTIETLRGHLAAGEAELRLALAGAEDLYGKDHPDTADAVINLAQNLEAQGRIAEALQLSQRAHASYLRRLGPEHPRMAGANLLVGRLLRRSGDARAALPLLERAVALNADKDPLALAEARLALGQALWEARGDRRRARALGMQARATYAAFAAKYPQKANQEELQKADQVLAGMR